MIFSPPDDERSIRTQVRRASYRTRALAAWAAPVQPSSRGHRDRRSAPRPRNQPPGGTHLEPDCDDASRPWSGQRVRQLWQRFVHAVSWTPPTSTEIGIVAKSALAAGLSWWIAGVVTDVPDPVLAPLTALVVVQVSVRASVRTALQRSAAVVLGVLLALAIGDALGLNGFTVAVLVAVSLGVAQLVLRLPAAAARQVPDQRPGRAHGRDVEPAEPRLAAGRGHRRSGPRSGSWSRWCCRRRGWSTPARRSTGWRAASAACSRRWARGCSSPGPPSRPRSGGGRRARRAIAWSTRLPRRSATAARPRAGTSAIDATSTSSVATRR